MKLKYIKSNVPGFEYNPYDSIFVFADCMKIVMIKIIDSWNLIDFIKHIEDSISNRIDSIEFQPVAFES